MAAGVIGACRVTGPVIGKTNLPILTATRFVSRTSSCQESEGWLSKLGVRRMEPTKESHSRMLSDKEVIYALHTHNIRPDSYDKYIKNYKENVDLIHSKKGELNHELVASWTVEVGDLDQAIHLWQYTGGYSKIDHAQLHLSQDEIGRLYNVHHIWCYKDLQSRKETRESAWRSPGWDECVAYTVPLIREMHCRILRPTSFSPTQ